MGIKDIQRMFSEMGLGSSEQREKLVKELSINTIDGSYNENKNLKTCNNTLKPDSYA